ncbi:MAG TPA: hypothetical protein VK837_07830 [Longimicrobiales bacterium]|nr:hypothetical protein [Longimicrobiales bacterium]
MFSARTRWLLITGASLLAFANFVRGRNGIGAIFAAAALLVLWGHWRYGSVFAAWQALLKEDRDKARRLLAGTPRPAFLARRHRAYYHWVRGLLLAHEGETGAAREQLESALSGPLRSSSNEALLRAQLAELEIGAGRWSAAERHLLAAHGLRARPGVAAIVDGLAAELRERKERDGPT